MLFFKKKKKPEEQKQTKQDDIIRINLDEETTEEKDEKIIGATKKEKVISDTATKKVITTSEMRTMTTGEMKAVAKKSKNPQHVTPRPDGRWQVLGANNQKATKIFRTQKEAIEYAEKIAEKQESRVVIHGKDGKIRKN